MEMTKKYNFTNLSNGRLQLMLQTAEEIHQRMQQPDRPEEAAWKEEFPPITTAPAYSVKKFSENPKPPAYFSFSTNSVVSQLAVFILSQHCVHLHENARPVLRGINITLVVVLSKNENSEGFELGVLIF